MHTKTSDTFSTLTPDFDAACDQFTCFGRETTRLHDAIQISDETSRAVFTALTRIQALSDQIDLILALMKEDVRVVEELSKDPEDANRSERFGDSFQRWLRTSRDATLKIN